MRFQACSALVVLSAGLTLGAPSARAETIWQWTHQAEGEGWANVFDGGPPDFESDITTGPGDTRMHFLAVDDTRPGVLGAAYGTSGTSQLFPEQDYLLIDLGFNTDYSATSRLGSDRPGGEGSGWIRSVVEVVMPVDTVEWGVDVDVNQTPGFSGSTRIVLENVTKSTTVFDGGEGGENWVTLQGVAGDTMRMTFEAEGQGSAPAGIPAISFYEVEVSSAFIVPEPATVTLAALGVMVLMRRRL